MCWSEEILHMGYVWNGILRENVDKLYLSLDLSSVDTEALLWNEKVQECIQRKRLVKKKWNKKRTEGRKQRKQKFRKARHMIKVGVKNPYNRHIMAKM